jgi:hypothetical protein
MTSSAARKYALAIVAAVVFFAGVAAAAPAHAGPDEREIQAREDFAAGRYQVALEIFARLYAETLHPNYLRNIGRCYQYLGEPDRAITSFHDYLHKAKHISPEERTEIEGYIKEMEQLKKSREASPASAAPTAPPPKAAVAPLPAAPPPKPEPRTATVDLTRRAPPPVSQPEESPPVYERWWFWAAIAGAAGVGVGVAAATGAFTHYNNAACPTTPATMCFRSQ